MRWAIVVAAAFLFACNDDANSSPGHVHVGCEAGASCTEDFSVIGICAQDRPHMCFCGANGNTSPPSSDCLGNEVKPPKPNTQAYCCP
jgi:hypothetical protein